MGLLSFLPMFGLSIIYVYMDMEYYEDHDAWILEWFYFSRVYVMRAKIWHAKGMS